MDLEEQTMHYVQFRDAIKKAIKGYDKEEGKIIFHYKEYDHTYFVISSITKEFLEELHKITPPHKITLVFEKNSLAEKTCLDHWETLSSKENMSIMFFGGERPVLLHPQTHAKIAEKESFKQGFHTMLFGE